VLGHAVVDPEYHGLESVALLAVTAAGRALGDQPRALAEAKVRVGLVIGPQPSSPESAAAIAISRAPKVEIGERPPRRGRIRLRIQTAGPKMKSLLLG
jgi:hypothetical protein